MKPQAVLLDRDGTIVVDEPYNGDPEKVVLIDDAKAALDRLRARGLRLAVLTNQSGVGRGLITMAQVDAVNARIEALLGPFEGWFICPHAPAEECACRKPKPKLVFDAAASLGVDPDAIVVVGDKDSDVEAARNAGAAGIKIDGTRSLADAVEEILARL